MAEIPTFLIDGQDVPMDLLRRFLTRLSGQAEAALLNSVDGATPFATLALAQAAPGVGAGTQARVFADPDPAKNGLYVNATGAAGGYAIDAAFYAALSSVVRPLLDETKAARDVAVAAARDAVAAAGSTKPYDAINQTLPADRNLFDASRAQPNSIIAATNGGSSNGTTAGWTASDYIYVGNGAYFIADFDIYGDSNYGVASYSRYGDAASFTAGTPGQVPAGTPVQAKGDYVRFSTQVTTTAGLARAQVVAGQVLPAGFRSFNVADDATAARLANAAARMARPVLFNLFNPQDITLGLQLGQNGSGEPGSSGDSDCTGYFPVEPGVPITPNFEYFAGNAGVGFAWYDRLLRPIGGTPNQGANISVIPPAKAAFGRTSFFKNQRNIQITNGAVGAGAIVVGWDDVLRHKPFAGKRGVFDGDSIMAGGFIGGFPLWAQDVAAGLGLAPPTVLAFNGAQMRQTLSGATQQTFAGVDVYVNACGTNDLGNPTGPGQPYASTGRPLGTLGDTSAAGTFFGDMHGVFIERLGPWIEANGGRLKQFMCTPQKRFDDVYGTNVFSDGNPVNTLGFHLSDIAAAIKVFGRAAGISVLDLFEDGPLNSFSYKTLTGDGIHPLRDAYIRELNGRLTKHIEGRR